MEDNLIRFSIDIPADLHKQLKSRCVEYGVSMKMVLQELIKEFINKDNDETF